MKTTIRKITTMLLAIMVLVSCFSLTALAAYDEMPDTIIRDGRTFVRDDTAGGGANSAELDETYKIPAAAKRYTLLASDVRMYIDYSHGHGGDQFSSGWVQTDAPSFYARAEVRLNGAVVVSDTNRPNTGDIAYSTSPLSVGINNNRTAHIFYGYYY